jgi:hypothetical protein
MVATFSGLAMILAGLFAVFALYPEAPALGIAGLIAGTGGALAVARRYWASSTRKVRERIGVVVDVIGQTLTQSETQASGFKEGRGRRCGARARCERSRGRGANRGVNLALAFGRTIDNAIEVIAPPAFSV